MPVEQIVSDSRSKMKKAVEFLTEQLKAVRTARASVGLVENIRADFYGTPTPLKQMATLATPQPDMIVIKPFDPTSLREIEKAIKNSDLSIAPLVDGKLIRLNIPPLSAERRTQLASNVKQIGEQAKIGIRSIRRDANKHLESRQKDKLVTEDDLDRGKKQIDDITREFIDKLDLVVKNKSDEIILE